MTDQGPPPLPADGPPPLPAEGPPPPPPPPPLPADGPPPPSAPEEASRERASFQVTEDTRTYPCHQCGAQLVFDIGSQTLACPSCGARSDIDVSSLGRPDDHDLRSTMAELRSLAGSASAPQVQGEKEIVCQNCGGHTTFSGTLTATRCPYCATPIQRDDVQDAPSRLPVDTIVPFKVDTKAAEAALDQWINGRRFAPREFKKYAETGSFASVYAAYFTYDADADTSYDGRRGDNYTVTVGSGDNRRTETRIRWRSASGTVHDRFDDVAVLANDGFDHKRVKALEPWPTATAQPFTPEFVAGHLSRTYDHDAEASFVPAKAIMDETIEGTIKRDIGGDHQRIESRNTRFNALTFRHVLLPIWLLTVVFEGEPFQVFINGVTGEVQGQRPWSKVKIAAAVVLALVVIAVIVFLYQRSRSGGA